MQSVNFPIMMKNMIQKVAEQVLYLLQVIINLHCVWSPYNEQNATTSNLLITHASYSYAA